MQFGYREYLLECARKIGVEGAAEFLEDPNNGLNEVRPLLVLSCCYCFPSSRVKGKQIYEAFFWFSDRTRTTELTDSNCKIVFRCEPKTDLACYVKMKVKEELNKYSGNINGVPHFVVGDEKSNSSLIYLQIVSSINDYMVFLAD